MLWLFTTAASVAQTASLHAVSEAGPRSRRINVVFLSEGYPTGQMNAFAGHVDAAISYLTEREPWKQYRSYLNFYRIEVASNESGTDNGSDETDRDTYFETGFNYPTVAQLLAATVNGKSKAFSLLNQYVPEYDVPIILVNDSKYGGSGGTISIASAHQSSPLILEHEIGHSFADLADEYDFEYDLYTLRERYNVTQETDRSQIRWRSWIEAGTPIPTPETSSYNNQVGLFEGASYRTNGWYRPHNNSVMRNLGQPVGAVNREKFILSIYEEIGPIESNSPASSTIQATGTTMLEFSVTPKVPSVGPALTVQWQLNGTNLTGANQPDFAISSARMGNGNHTVSAFVQDPSGMVRDDPANLLRETVAWNVTLSDQLPPTLAEWRTAYGNDSANPSGDGLNNIAKFALGLDPAQIANASEQPVLQITTNSAQQYLTIQIPRRVIRPEPNYLIRSSPILETWPITPQVIVLEDSPTMLKVRDSTPFNGSSQRFMDFRIQIP
jgi:hypothetical protein